MNSRVAVILRKEKTIKAAIKHKQTETQTITPYNVP